MNCTNFFFSLLLSLPSLPHWGQWIWGDGERKPLSEVAIWQQPRTILFLAPGGWTSGSVVYYYYYCYYYYVFQAG